MIRSRSTSRRGFTLVEILAVLVILGIASAIIVPQINSRDDLVVQAASRTVMADLIYAQNYAISNQSTTYVRFYNSASGNKYTVLSACSALGDTMLTHPVNKDNYEVLFGNVAGSQFRSVEIDSAIFDGVDATFADEFTIGFDELGTPRVFCYDQGLSNELGEGGTNTTDHGIILKSGGFGMRITIERYTGEIGVQVVP